MTTEGKLKRSRNPLDFDFTEPEALTRYVTETGKILPRKLTGLTARQQRHIAKAVKRARNMISLRRRLFCCLVWEVAPGDASR